MLPHHAFARLAALHERRTRFRLRAIDAQGRFLDTLRPCLSRHHPPPPPPPSRTARAGNDDAADCALRAQALAEALRWGEPSVTADGNDRLMWAIPVMKNQRTLGGLLVAGVPLDRRGAPGSLDGRVMRACKFLVELAVEHDLTNAAFLEERRRQARRESEWAEALHETKFRLYDDIRAIYLREEPALLAAIRRGERGEARNIINRVLTAIYTLGRTRLDLLKSLCLELVVIMTRTAVQAGGAPARILGLNFQSLSTLANLTNQEQLARWLCEMLEVLLDAIQDNTRQPNAVQLHRAVEHMEEHYADELSRDEVARVAGLSRSHFSRLMRQRTGASFTDMLTRIRLDHACRLLRRGEDIAQVALSCGFADQSYFNRVFKKRTGLTPGEYAKGSRGSRDRERGPARKSKE
ncbi:AraC family transcriptional regulator [Opitutaceae bacterium TAV3]|nr:AraC family transcriptional regulator [Opitutaceae bacterium TAV3]